jgi:FKBP-type peptidyl-prolyl cis-trans isomerase 2
MQEQMKKIKESSQIRLHYTLSTEDTLIDTTESREPLQLTLGQGELHPALESLLLGLSEGDTLERWLDANIAFGEYDPQLKIQIAQKKLPENLKGIQTGVSFETLGPDKKKRLFRVIESNDAFVVIDGNHPLAGEALLFEAQIVEVLS